MVERINCNYMPYLTVKKLLDNVNEMHFNLGNQSQVFELNLKLRNIVKEEIQLPNTFTP